MKSVTNIHPFGLFTVVVVVLLLITLSVIPSIKHTSKNRRFLFLEINILFSKKNNKNKTFFIFSFNPVWDEHVQVTFQRKPKNPMSLSIICQKK